MTTRIVIDLATDDEKALIRLLKALLKRLGRDHGVRCERIEATSTDG